MNQVGYAVCHQMPSRSLHYGGRSLPVCARDTGMFLAFAVVFIALIALYGRRPLRTPSRPKVAVLCALVLPLLVDAVTSYAGLRESNNAVRLITGALAGTAGAALLFPLFSSVVLNPGEHLSGTDAHERRALGTWPSLAVLLIAPIVVCLAMWPDWPGAYWLMAPFLTLAILLALAALNLTLVALILDHVVGAAHIPAWAPGAIAGVAALAELALANGLHRLADHIAR